MRKPLACSGCPALGFSSQWVPDETKPGAHVFVLNQNPGEVEEVEGRPMVGPTGQAWESRFLKDSGLSRDEISIGNVIRCRWHGSNDLPPVSSILVKRAMAHCQTAHFKIPESTRLLVAAGDYACQALTGSTVADGDKAGNGWRGYLKPLGGSDAPSYWLPSPSQPLPVLVTWHIARTFHEPRLIIPTRRDWQKVPKILKGTWPIAPPYIETDPSKVRLTDTFTLDTEYVRNEDQLIRMSLAGLDGSVYVLEAEDLVKYYYETVQEMRRSLQSFRVDMQQLLGQAQCSQASSLSSRTETSQGEVVSRLLSICSPPRKGEIHDSRRVSNSPRAAARPLLDLWSAGGHVTPTEARSRPRPYQWPISGADLSAVQHGLGFIQGRSGIAPKGAWIPRIISQYSPADIRYAQEFIPFGFYLDDTVWQHAVLWSDQQHDLNYLASIYGPYNRHKHLIVGDPILYSGLDAAVLIYIWRALEAELDADPQSRFIWEQVDRPALGEFVRAQYRGIRTDPARLASAIAQLQAEVDQASLQAQALVGWPINLASNLQVAHQLYKIEGLKVPRGF